MGTTERNALSVNGFVVAALLVLLTLGAIAAATSDTPGGVIAAMAVAAGVAIGMSGFLINQPNHAKVVILFGRYVGTVARDGFWWTVPLTVKRTISLRIRNFDSDSLKVNDAAGNPVEIASVINWQVVDSAKAVFDVDDYASFVQIQTEAAVRHVASAYPYESYEDDDPSLRANADEVTATLQQELQERLRVAGVAVLDTRLRRLAYAPEIAQEMLRRQQASAVVAARYLIVEGAVGMVQHALNMLNEQDIVELDEEKKAAMVSNLLVVLCSERGTQPVVNSGTLYT